MSSPVISPAEFLTGITPINLPTRLLTIITGYIHSGKTNWCFEVMHQAYAVGWHVGGVISPAVFEDGVKTGIDLMDVVTGERRRLAIKRETTAQNCLPQLGSMTLNWCFDPDVFSWGNRILQQQAMGEFLVLDELGPLELLENCGLTVGLEIIDKERYVVACVVVRPALLDLAQARWPKARVVWAQSPTQGEEWA